MRSRRIARTGPAAALLAFPAFLAAGCSATEADVADRADVVFRGGPVWTAGASGGPGPTARALAVRDGRIVAVGGEADVQGLIGPSTEVVELDGRALLPGFVDAHTHFLVGGFKLAGVQLRDAATPDDFAARIGAFAREAGAGEWITGGDWDHEAWGGELPRREWIDSLTAENPVFVNRLDGHMALANTRALEAAGVDAGGATTPDPDGGTIVRDPDTGEATGVLKDAAMGLVGAVVPEPTEAERDRALRAAAAHALSLGVTQVHDMGSWRELDTYRRARDAGELPLRVYSVVPIATWRRLRDLVEAEGRGDRRLWWGGLKGFVDGSLGSTTAWFYEPYDDQPETSGLMTTDTASLRSWILDADAAGLHVIVHAIGDRANDWLLDVYEDVVRRNGRRDRRLRVEHAQHLSPGAVGRFARQDVIPSMQPYHAADDGRWAEKRIGADRIRTTYAFRSLLDAGARLAFGSDWTVAPIDPLAGLDAAVTRRTLDGANPDGWVPEQKIGLEEALTAYTLGAAYAGFAEDDTGVLWPGALADLVVLSGDPFAAGPADISSFEVDRTYVEGREAFRREGR